VRKWRENKPTNRAWAWKTGTSESGRLLKHQGRVIERYRVSPMKSRSRREVIEDIQYAVFWLANEVHSLPRERAFQALPGEISDEAIDLCGSVH
jgi:hypothetical protein